MIIDLKCAQAILRGADLFVPGVIGLSFGVKSGDLISIYADLSGKCLKGSDANVFMATSANSLYFVGNGWSNFDRDDIFKNSQMLKSYEI